MIHIFSCAAAAGTFRQLLDERDIAEEVAAISEELDFGPISHGTLADRAAWLDKSAPFSFGSRDWLAESEAEFGQRVSGTPERLIWIAPASATDQAGLYWYLSKFGGDGTALAIADYPVYGAGNGTAPLRLSQLNVEAMGHLYDECPRLPWTSARFPEDRWSALVAENAHLRAVVDGQLRSVPDAYFDDFLIARCPADWTWIPRVLAHAMGVIWDTGQCAGSDLLLWRLRALIENGRILCDGALPIFEENTTDNVNIRRAA